MSFSQQRPEIGKEKEKETLPTDTLHIFFKLYF
jgi:hypothetical protein